jgi:hypothetical protein
MDAGDALYILTSVACVLVLAMLGLCRGMVTSLREQNLDLRLRVIDLEQATKQVPPPRSLPAPPGPARCKHENKIEVTLELTAEHVSDWCPDCKTTLYL